MKTGELWWQGRESLERLVKACSQLKVAELFFRVE